MKKKLFDLKEWLTLDDTAKYLSILFGEEVSVADVLRLALDGHLTLSVDFVNHARARFGSVKIHTPEEIAKAIESGELLEDLEWGKLTDGFLEFLRELPSEGDSEISKLIIVTTRIDENRYLALDKKVKTIRGIWDLPMVGAEKLDVEHYYQSLTGGPSVELMNIEGAFVQDTKNELVICQLQESFDQNEYQDGSEAQLKSIKQRIRLEKIDKEKGEELLAKHAQARKDYLAKRDSRPKEDDYYPAGTLPQDCNYVVRTANLRNFEAAIDDASHSPKEINTTERNTLLTIISALCHQSGIAIEERGVAGRISRMTEKIGVPISEDTIRNKLKEIKEVVDTKSDNS